MGQERRKSSCPVKKSEKSYILKFAEVRFFPDWVGPHNPAPTATAKFEKRSRKNKEKMSTIAYGIRCPPLALSLSVKPSHAALHPFEDPALNALNTPLEQGGHTRRFLGIPGP